MSRNPHDVFDGHERYRERAASWLSMLVRSSNPDAALGMLSALLAALALAATVGRWLWSPGNIAANVIAIGATLLALGTGAFLGAFFARGAAHDRRQKWVVRLALLAWFLGAFVLPLTWWKPEPPPPAPVEQPFMVSADKRIPLTAGDEAWLADVYAAGAHGAAGASPPLLTASLDEDHVLVTNVSGRTLGCVRMSTGSNARQHEACRMVVGYRNPVCESMEPGSTLTFVFQNGAPESCSTEPLSYEIGSPSLPEPSWWSDSALDAWMAWRGLKTP